ncbi:MAG: hypothetical protein ACRD1V_02645, partial [Vicinamibacterales bacterium]
PARAAHWYWSQAVLSVGPNLARRFRSPYEQARRLETEKDRLARLTARKWALGMLALGATALRFPGYDVNGFVLIVFGALIFVGSLVARRSSDEAELARGRRRLNLIWLVWAIGILLPHMFGHTHAAETASRVCMLLGGSFMMWPGNYWVFSDSTAAYWERRLPRQGPQVRTPFIGLRRAQDGSLFLGIDAADGPASLGDPILGRADRNIIGIDRKFSPADAIRVFAAVGEGSEPARVTLDMLDSSEHVMKSSLVPIAPAEVVASKVRLKAPKVALGQVDQTISLSGLAPGRYRLRLVATDGEHASEKSSDFRVV